MQPDPAAIARAFDLGEPTTPAVGLPGRSRASVITFGTARGRWVAKAARPSTSDDLAVMTIAGAVETGARAAGVATPRPVPVVSPYGYWAPLPGTGGTYVRVSEYVDGHRPEVPLPPPLARWLGTSLAAIAASAPPGEPPAGVPLDPGRLPAGEPGLVGAVAALTDLVAAADGGAAPARHLHRDVNRRNILVAASGPLLLDFDQVAPEVAWHDLVHHAFLLACEDLGPQEPDPTCVRTAVEAYLAAGGEPGEATPTAFAALARGLLAWVAAGLDDPQGTDTLRRAAVSLPLVVAALPRWCALLG